MKTKLEEVIRGIEDVMFSIEVPVFFELATGRKYNDQETCINDIRRMLMIFYNNKVIKEHEERPRKYPDMPLMSEQEQVDMRVLLALAHEDKKCHIYHDDGELQCNNSERHGRFMDFRRETITSLLNTVQMTRMKECLEPPKEADKKQPEGEWILDIDNKDFDCSICGQGREEKKRRFCPDCGAEMK